MSAMGAPAPGVTPGPSANTVAVVATTSAAAATGASRRRRAPRAAVFLPAAVPGAVLPPEVLGSPRALSAATRRRSASGARASAAGSSARSARRSSSVGCSFMSASFSASVHPSSACRSARVHGIRPPGMCQEALASCAGHTARSRARARDSAACAPEREMPSTSASSSPSSPSHACSSRISRSRRGQRGEGARQLVALGDPLRVIRADGVGGGMKRDAAGATPMVREDVARGAVQPRQRRLVGDVGSSAPRGGEHLGGQVVGILTRRTPDEVAVDRVEVRRDLGREPRCVPVLGAPHGGPAVRSPGMCPLAADSCTVPERPAPPARAPTP